MAQIQYRYPTLEELLDRLGLEYSGSHMNCPFCHGKKTVKLKFDDNVWRCAKCEVSGGNKHLYAYVHEGLSPDSYPTDRREIAALSKRLSQFMGFDPGPCQQPTLSDKVNRPIRKREKVFPASDDHLDAVYQALMTIPELQLLPEHKELLLKRGLSEQAIERNGYRSIPESVSLPKLYHDMYLHDGGKYPSSRKADSIRLGLYVADKLIQQGLTLKGVPGFYKFGIHWCYWCVPGILIPTRNYKGQIVIWQVRKDKLRSKNEAKYLTVSCQDFPGAVTEAVSRCHFPIGNAPLDSGASLLITEGPLKADVACHLYGSPVSFAAIPGISTTTDLLSLSPLFLKLGKQEVYNALDMDRMTNANVRRGCEKIRSQFLENGITFSDIFWGDQYAAYKLRQLSLLARRNRIHIHASSCDSVFLKLSEYVKALEAAGIAPCPVTALPDGTKETHYWDPDTKGIDDFLFSTKRI